MQAKIAQVDEEAAIVKEKYLKLNLPKDKKKDTTKTKGTASKGKPVEGRNATVTFATEGKGAKKAKKKSVEVVQLDTEDDDDAGSCKL
jgi:hypothetical protein